MVQPNKSAGYRQRTGYQGPGRQSGGGNTPSPQLLTPKPLAYYSDPPDKKRLKPDLLDDHARKDAESFKDLKAAQIRRFYDEIKAIERKIMYDKDLDKQKANFDEARALITMFKAKAVYAEKRKVAPRAFTQFIFDHVASINDLADFKGFLKVFEAVVAFHKFFSPEK